MIFGADGMEKLKNSRVAVFGIGGVGGHAAEALVRGGVGAIDLFDDDKISITNINRQIFATMKTVGEYKVDAAKKRILEINPEIFINTNRLFFLPETSNQVNFNGFDYIIDAIDTITGKIELVLKAREYGIPIISSMGAGNKVDPAGFITADIYETSVCPVARVMRRELKKLGIKNLKVVYSREPAVNPLETQQDGSEEPAHKRQIPGSSSFTPPTAGLIIAGEVIKYLAGYEKNN